MRSAGEVAHNSAILEADRKVCPLQDAQHARATTSVPLTKRGQVAATETPPQQIHAVA